MEKTYKITLPKGAKVYTIDAKADDGVLNVTVNLEQKYVPKDGDIVYAQWEGDRSNYKWIFIYKKSLTDPYKRPATEAEKQRLFDALAKQGKRWNAEKKCVEDLPRWRAKKNGTYYYVNDDSSIRETKEMEWAIDNDFYNVGNYFRTREAAEKVAEQIKDIFKNSKAE